MKRTSDGYGGLPGLYHHRATVVGLMGKNDENKSVPHGDADVGMARTKFNQSNSGGYVKMDLKQ